MKRSISLLSLVFSLLCMSNATAQVSFSGVIDANFTYNVPADFSSINAALTYLANKTIKDNVIITIQVANGTYSSLSEINIHHPQGDRIYIVGNTTTPTSCVLQFTGNGFNVTDSNKIGLINGFKLVGANTGYGISASYGASAYCGANMEITGFQHGVYAEYGGTVKADYVHSYSNTQNGLLAKAGTISGKYAVVNNNGQNGLAAYAGGNVDFDHGTAYANTMHSAIVFAAGSIWAPSASLTFTVNGGNLYNLAAHSNGTIFVQGATISGGTDQILNNGTIEY